MKTKILLSVASLFITIVAVASPITETEAQKKAADFMSDRKSNGKIIQSKALITEAPKFTTAESCDAFYVFNNETGGGYVIVSADDRMPAVLGYSYTGAFKSDEIPENMRSWLNGYVEQYEYMLEHDDATAVSTTSVTGEKIYPLLTTKWNQSYPYNAKCPTIDGSHAPTGCVATAMAQIMYYHQWPKQTTKTIPGYTTYTNKITMPSIGITSIDWDNMLPMYGSDGKYSTTKEEAISTLFNLCGTSIEMDYREGGSAASIYAAMRALSDYFDYQEQILRDVYQYSYQYDEWNQLIYDEICNKRPVLYSGDSESSGHAFVIDGYDKNDYFHVNWGWGGNKDDYFLLNALNGYNYNQSAIIGIQNPNTTEGAKYVYTTYKDNTLTFYFDNKRDKRQETVYKSTLPIYDSKEYTYKTEWQEKASSITTVVFDESFSEIKPSSTACWFQDLTKLTNIQGIEYLNTQNVTDMSDMFHNCSSLTSLDVSKFNTQNVTNMSGMFYKCSGLTSLDVSKFNTRNVIGMAEMFKDCSGLTSLDVSKFDTRNVIYMGSMFNNCRSLKNLDVSNFNTQNVEKMGYMFYKCSSLISLDVSKFDTRKVSDMGLMFCKCSSLTSLDVSNFNTQNVEYMWLMFSGCSSLTSLDLSSFNTQKVTKMIQMLEGCNGLTSLDLSNFNTQNVEAMGWMFYNCSNLTSLDLSSFNTQKVTSMNGMFYNCDKLKTIYVGDNWDTSNVTESTGMFMYCYDLIGQDGTKYNSNYTDVTKAHYGTGGYLTYGSSSAVNEVKGNMSCSLIKKNYSIDGKFLSQPQKGLNIIRMSDGTTRKIVR